MNLFTYKFIRLNRFLKPVRSIFFLSAFSSLIISLPNYLLAGKGGPDKFGYTWKDSNDSDGPVYSWYEIPLTTDLYVTGLGDDNVMGPFPLGGKFTFYWYPVDEFWVGANGYISFYDDNIDAPFPSIPDSTNDLFNYIAPMMSDLTFAGPDNPGKCLYQITQDSLIVSYLNVPFWDGNSSTSYTGSNTFQVILNRVDKSITFNYQTQQGPTQSNITVGIENLTGSIGVEALSTYPTNGYSIKFYYPENPTLKIVDGGINWNTTVGAKGFFLPYPTSNFPLLTDVINVGNQVLQSYNVMCEVSDPLGTVDVSSDVQVTGNLTSSDDTIITFPSTFTPVITGVHSYRTKISGIKGDNDQTDDTLTQKIVVIDTSQTQLNLSYANVLNQYSGSVGMEEPVG